MIYKLQAQSGSCRDSMWCGPAEHTGMPSPSEQDDWGACTSLSGQRSNRGAPYGVSRGREVSKAYPPARSYNLRPTGAATMATRALKVSAHRSRHRQGTLTIIGSNVRLGTEMPVALSLSFP